MCVCECKIKSQRNSTVRTETKIKRIYRIIYYDFDRQNFFAGPAFFCAANTANLAGGRGGSVWGGRREV